MIHEELKRLQKEYDLNWQRAATGESSVTVLHKELEVATARDSELDTKKKKVLKKLETFSTTHAEAKAGLSKDLSGTRADLGKETKECDALRAKAGRLVQALATLHDAPKVSDEKIQRLELQANSDVKPVARLATLVKDHRSNCLCVTTEKGKLRRQVNDMEGKFARLYRLRNKFSRMSILNLGNKIFWWRSAKTSLFLIVSRLCENA